MKSLEAREAFRAKQKEANRAEGERTGTAAPTEDERSKEREQKDKEARNADPFATVKDSKSDADVSDEDKQAAADFVNRTVDEIKSDLSTLTDEQLELVRKAEKSGSKRASVFDAIKKERAARDAAGSNWNAGK